MIEHSKPTNQKVWSSKFSDAPFPEMKNGALG